jgi:hypothetical protein
MEGISESATEPQSRRVARPLIKREVVQSVQIGLRHVSQDLRKNFVGKPSYDEFARPQVSNHPLAFTPENPKFRGP